jgi:UDP-N-acetylmuramate dehydrogenase
LSAHPTRIAWIKSGAEISKKHAGFIINRENATAEDVKKIIEYVKERVYASRGFVPEEEIEYI